MHATCLIDVHARKHAANSPDPAALSLLVSQGILTDRDLLRAVTPLHPPQPNAHGGATHAYASGAAIITLVARLRSSEPVVGFQRDQRPGTQATADAQAGSSTHHARMLAIAPVLFFHQGEQSTRGRLYAASCFAFFTTRV